MKNNPEAYGECSAVIDMQNCLTFPLFCAVDVCDCILTPTLYYKR